MGTSSTKPAVRSQSAHSVHQSMEQIVQSPRSPLTPVPLIYYLNRSEKFALIISQTKTEKIRFAENIDMYADSAVGELNDFTVFVAGGSDIYGTASSTAYIIDLRTMQVDLISPLPMPCKYGHIIVFQGYVYYLGGVTEDQQIPDKFQGSPIMRYSMRDKAWEVFFHDNRKFAISEELENKFRCFEEKLYFQEFELKDLLLPGVFLLDNRIFFYGGMMMGKEPTANHSVLSVDLQSEELELTVEPFYFQYSLNKPLSASNRNQVIIVGGEDFNFVPSTLWLKFTLKKGFQEIKSQGVMVLENYPPKYTDQHIIIIAFPKILVKQENSEGWVTLNLCSKSKVMQPVKRIVGVKNSVGKNPPLYKKGNFAVDSGALTTNATMSSRNPQSSSLPHRRMTSRLDSRRSTLSRREFGLEENKVAITEEPESINNESKVSPRNFRMNREILDEDIKDGILENFALIEADHYNLISIPHKVAIKLIAVASDKIQNMKLTGLDLNLISQQLEFKEVISIREIEAMFREILVEKSYATFLVSGFIKVIHRIIERPRLSSAQIFQIFDILMISRKAAMIEKDSIVMLITRILIATCINQV